MPRVQTFLTNDVIEEINAIIEQRIAEGASAKEVNLSNMTNMLVELGLRVYRLQREDKPDAFNQTEFNKLLLESAVSTRLLSSKVLAALKLLPDLKEMPQFDLLKIKNDVESDTKEIISRLFPVIDNDLQD
jgi:hypothetical protein